MYTHILIATDGSELSDHAVGQGLELARVLGAQVTLFTAVAPFHMFSVEPYTAGDQRAEYRRRALERAEGFLQSAREKAEALGVSCQSVAIEHSYPHQAILDTARERYSAKPGFWHRLRNKPTPAADFRQADLAETGLPDESLDLVWSNLALHWHPEPHLVLQEWRRVLRNDALAMYSSLGPGTFRELRDALAEADPDTRPMEFVDIVMNQIPAQAGVVERRHDAVVGGQVRTRGPWNSWTCTTSAT